MKPDTCERRVWLCLQEFGPLSARQISQRLGLPVIDCPKHPTRVASDALSGLKEKGLIRSAGYRLHEIVPGSKAPIDGRGVFNQYRPKPKAVKPTPKATAVELPLLESLWPSPAFQVATRQ